MMGLGGLSGFANLLAPLVTRAKGTALAVRSPGGLYNVFEVYTKALPSEGRKAHVYIRMGDLDASEQTIENILEVDDASGAPMVILPSEGGLWVNDALKFVQFINSAYQRAIALDYGNVSQNRAPMLIFGSVANTVSGISSVIANGVEVTLNASKGAFLRLTDTNRFQFSLPVEVPTAHIGGRAIFGGTGDPEGVQAAEQGALFLSDTATYRKTTNGGSTGWVALQ